MTNLLSTIQKTADPHIYETLVRHKIVTVEPAIQLRVIEDAQPFSSARLGRGILAVARSPVLLTVWIDNQVKIRFPRVHSSLPVRYARSLLFGVTSVVKFVSKMAAFLIRRRSTTRKVRVLEWLISPGQHFSPQTPIFQYRFCSWNPFRFRDRHTYQPTHTGVFVQRGVPPGHVARKGTLFTFIPQDVYDQVTPTAKLSLEEMARLVSNKLQAYETNSLSQSQAEALASLSGQLTRLVGAESLQQSITSAIAGFVAEIEAIQSNPHLDPDSKRIMTAQVQSLLNTFCNQARQ